MMFIFNPENSFWQMQKSCGQSDLMEYLLKCIQSDDLMIIDKYQQNCSRLTAGAMFLYHQDGATAAFYPRPDSFAWISL